jgi:membrane fusion protein, copper/silver efflux system
MTSHTRVIAAVVLAAAAFAAGYLAAPQFGGRTAESGRTVLYYVDPMNPSFRSAEPGTAPCGMPLEPVYADGEGGADGGGQNGLINVRADRQQLIGVTFGTAVVATVPHTLRLLGTVAVDQTRLYEIGSVTQGFVREVSSATTGTSVRKGEILAKYYSPESFNPQQAYIFALDYIDRQNQSGQQPQEQGPPLDRALVTSQALLNVGMTQEQIDNIGRTRQIEPLIEIRAPADGFILDRNVYLGQAFEPSTQLYTIADLREVWILADAFETDARFLEPGRKVTVSHSSLDRDLEAVASHVLPEFDAATRTLKVRLEASNPGFRLRPGMFVDVTVPVELGPALTVPKDAVLDSGSRQVVFVDRGEGFFEPRRVTTGWRYAGRVEIVTGLMEGERIVTSGNFLLDSESRMRTAGTDPLAEMSIDPVCGMEVENARARARGLTSVHDGRTIYFCNPGCKEKFDQNPDANEASAS